MQFSLRPIDPRTLTSIRLRQEAYRHRHVASLEAYRVVLDGTIESAECLYFRDRDLAGIAWGAEPNWIDNVRSAAAACQLEFAQYDDASIQDA